MNCLEQITRLENQIRYIDEILTCEDIQKWEIIEFSGIKAEYQIELNNLKKHVTKHQELFN